MKKIKVAMMTMAIMLAVGGAFATQEDPACASEEQFWRFGFNTYVPAGEMGIDYICLTDIGVCTYYRPAPITNPNFYVPCRNGVIWLLL